MSRKHDPKILKRVVDAKLKISGALSNVKRGGFGSNPLGLASDNSIILDFQGLKPDSRYRMLLCFLEINLQAEAILRKIGRCKDLLKIDLAVFCTFSDLSPDQIYTFKTSGAHVLCLEETDYFGAPYQAVPDFIHVPDVSYNDLLDINFLANEIANRLRKKFHLVLSELAAEAYGDYGTFATREVMHFEDELLRETLSLFLPDNRGKLAIDVGCGDGRHSRVLAKYFDEVIAFDISHNMIEAARFKDRRELSPNTTPITYYECDVEYEEFPDEEVIIGHADFVCASFGMPSFVEDTAGFVRRVYRWLRPGGQALFTFYNAKSIGLAVETPWKERSLSALIDISRRALEVELRNDIRFSIYCRTFDEKVRSIVTTGFSLVKEYSYPHMLTLLPPSIFGSDEQPQDVARNLFPKIDREISSKKNFSRGHYVFLVLEKAEMCTEGFMRVSSVLKKAKMKYKILEHDEIVSMSDVEKLLNIPKKQMVKTVIFKRRDNKQFFVAILPSNSRVDISQLAKLTNCKNSTIDLADAKDIGSRFGFPIGGVSPFGFDKTVPVFIDNKICQTKELYMYMGVGDNRKTLKLSTPEFLRLIENYSCTNITSLDRK